MRKIQIGINVLVLLIVLLGVGVLVYKNSNDVNKVDTELIDIQGKINDIGELATAEYVYTISDVLSKPGLTLFGKEITSSKIVYQYSGTVKAGVIFSDIKVSVNDTRKQIAIDMPQSCILSNELDLNSLNILEEKYSTFNKISFSDVNFSQQECKETAEKSAIEKGILVNADENAKAMIESLLSSFYDLEEYKVYYD